MSCNEIININNISKTYKCFDNKIDIIKNLLFNTNNYTEYISVNGKSGACMVSSGSNYESFRQSYNGKDILFINSFDDASKLCNEKPECKGFTFRKAGDQKYGLINSLVGNTESETNKCFVKIS